MSEDQIIEALTDSLQGNMREIIGTIPLKDICNDRKRFGDEVQEKAQTDMNALGIEIISCNIQRVEDENDLINALGQDNMEQIKKDASIAKANAKKEVAIAEAEARKIANEADVEADRIIAERNNELEIKRSELKKLADMKKAEADAAYQIKEEEQRKTIEVTKANADIAKEEQYIILKQKEADGEAAILEMFFNAFPEAVKNAAEPLGNVESITMYGSGNNEKMIGSIMNTVTQVSDGIKGSTVLDVKSIIEEMIEKKKETNQDFKEVDVDQISEE